MAKGQDGIEVKLSQMNDSMLSHFDKIYGKLESLEQEKIFINASLKRLEEGHEITNASLKRLEEKVNRVESKLDTHMRQPAHA
jgi:exonuclease VII small subunit